MRIFRHNLWILSALLYPLSWVTYWGPNLSFVAWIAFVPLLIYLKNNSTSFFRFYFPSLAVITAWTSVSAGWLFHFPMDKSLVGLVFVSGTIHISIPFAFLYIIQRQISFNKAIVLFPFLWVVWEWLYLKFPHMMVTHLLAYGQGSNLWLIQMADIGGMWLIACWVMGFNVITYLIIDHFDNQLTSRACVTSLARRYALFFAIPLVYASYIFFISPIDSNKSMQVSIIPTHFGPGEMMDPNFQKVMIERTLHRTDSLAFKQIEDSRSSDLYVWPESATNYWSNFNNTASLLYEAASDWQGSLITGCIIPADVTGKEAYVAGVLIGKQVESSVDAIQYHYKSRLVPGAETMPYQGLLKKLFDYDESDSTFKLPGDNNEPLSLITRENNRFKLGVSLCYEQWHPDVWTQQANAGAELFVHMAGEGWYGSWGFAQFMANVSRIRAIETRRSVARSSNGGLSTFYNYFGQEKERIEYGSLDMSTYQMKSANYSTLYSKLPNFFPLCCISFLAIYLTCIFTKRPKKSTL